MGDFNYVIFRDRCPRCDITLDTFKAYYDEPLNESYVVPQSVSQFEAVCSNCHLELQYIVDATDENGTIIHRQYTDSNNNYDDELRSTCDWVKVNTLKTPKE